MAQSHSTVFACVNGFSDRSIGVVSGLSGADVFLAITAIRLASINLGSGHSRHLLHDPNNPSNRISSPQNSIMA
jgi:hypothetical protein